MLILFSWSLTMKLQEFISFLVPNCCQKTIENRYILPHDFLVEHCSLLFNTCFGISLKKADNFKDCLAIIPFLFKKSFYYHHHHCGAVIFCWPVNNIQKHKRFGNWQPLIFKIQPAQWKCRLLLHYFDAISRTFGFINNME